MKKKHVRLTDLDNDSIIEYWISLHQEKREFTRLNDLDGLDTNSVNIKLTHEQMRERGLFNVNVNRKERS